MESAPEWDAWEVLKTTSKPFISFSATACLCLISLTSPAKSLSWTSMLNTIKQRERG